VRREARDLDAGDREAALAPSGRRVSSPRVRLLGLSYILVFGTFMVEVVVQPRGDSALKCPVPLTIVCQLASRYPSVLMRETTEAIDPDDSLSCQMRSAPARPELASAGRDLDVGEHCGSGR